MRDTGYTILSLELFPTEFFEAIEEQFPYVDYSLTCWSTQGVISYTNNDYALEKVCFPEIITLDGTPYCSQRLQSALHYVSNNLKAIGAYTQRWTLDAVPEANLENTPIWVVKEMSSIPNENPSMVLEIWDPAKKNYDDPDLQN